jgi:hypothetical protein
MKENAKHYVHNCVKCQNTSECVIRILGHINFYLCWQVHIKVSQWISWQELGCPSSINILLIANPFALVCTSNGLEKFGNLIISVGENFICSFLNVFGFLSYHSNGNSFWRRFCEWLGQCKKIPYKFFIEVE